MLKNKNKRPIKSPTDKEGGSNLLRQAVQNWRAQVQREKSKQDATAELQQITEKGNLIGGISCLFTREELLGAPPVRENNPSLTLEQQQEIKDAEKRAQDAGYTY